MLRTLPLWLAALALALGLGACSAEIEDDDGAVPVTVEETRYEDDGPDTTIIEDEPDVDIDAELDSEDSDK